ncbi:MAG: CoA-binding protein [Bacteroidales bacterium]|nr:CoA-binding protein [Bacteroidales bacterium]MCF8458474.1 CoA-binding protein [Bacteroidales bacterium]
MPEKTMVVGASTNPERYAYKAVFALKDKGHSVVPLGIRKGKIDGLTIEQGRPDYSNIHTVTLYIGAFVQESYIDYILGLKPKRVIFNPGTENQDFFFRCEQNNIEAVEACTLVMLATNQY